jgi:hypothetical protein
MQLAAVLASEGRLLAGSAAHHLKWTNFTTPLGLILLRR